MGKPGVYMEITDKHGALVVYDDPAIEGLTRDTLSTIRQGKYDRDIEVYVDNQVVLGLLSRLRVRQPFRFLDKFTGEPEAQWYMLVEPVKTMGRFDPNPTFIVSSLVVAQAPPRDQWLESQRMRRKAPALPAPTRVLEFEDVEDKSTKD